jgi:hypothetical protein
MILDPRPGRFNAGEAADGRLRHMAWRLLVRESLLGVENGANRVSK